MNLAQYAYRVAALIAAVATTTLIPTAAHADPHPSSPGLVSVDPANQTPDVLDGHVNAFAEVGTTMIVAGDFSEVEQGGVVYARDNLFAFNTSTGAVLASFAPSAAGEVFDLQVTPDTQRVLVVGAFSDIDDAAHTAKAALLTVDDGSVVPSFTSPKPNGLIRDVVAAHGLYYVAGAFDAIDGHPGEYLAALNPDGSDSGQVSLDFAGTNNGGSTNVRSIDLRPDHAQLVVAGNFASINGRPRGQLALVDISSGGSGLSTWSTTRFAAPCGPHFDAYMRDVAYSPVGDYFVVANTGGPKGEQRTGLLCDSASRWDVSTAPNAQPVWVTYTGGDTLTSAIVDTNAVYVGGHQRWVNNSYGHNDAEAGAVAREGIAALDPRNGLPLSWDPGRRRGYGVYGFALTDDGLWVGSDTKGFGGELRERIAFCPRAGGSSLPPYATATLPGQLAQLLSTGNVRLRAFDGHTVNPGGSLPTDTPWATLRGAFVIDDVLYAGWADGTLTAQPFDGITLGAAEPVDLRGAFTELADVRALFFDPATHRVYYTLEGRKGLFYRYFQPETRVVGSWQYRAGSTAGLPLGRVGDAFLVKRKLFVTDTVTGNLRRVGWDSSTGSTTGPPRDVVGPELDGRNYGSTALVALS